MNPYDFSFPSIERRLHHRIEPNYSRLFFYIHFSPHVTFGHKHTDPTRNYPYNIDFKSNFHHQRYLSSLLDQYAFKLCPFD